MQFKFFEITLPQDWGDLTIGMKIYLILFAVCIVIGIIMVMWCGRWLPDSWMAFLDALFS